MFRIKQTVKKILNVLILKFTLFFLSAFHAYTNTKLCIYYNNTIMLHTLHCDVIFHLNYSGSQHALKLPLVAVFKNRKMLSYLVTRPTLTFTQ